MVISAEDILARLPHRHPFLAVDRVLEVVPGKKAVALKTISVDADSMRPALGRFSREALVIEAMAQTGALAYAVTGPVKGPAKKSAGGAAGYLAGLNDVVFHGRPKAGDILELTLEYVAGIGPMARFNGTARVSGEVLAEAGLTFTVEGAIPK